MKKAASGVINQTALAHSQTQSNPNRKTNPVQTHFKQAFYVYS